MQRLKASEAKASETFPALSTNLVSQRIDLAYATAELQTFQRFASHRIFQA